MLTIPFGTERSDSKADPRVAFGLRQNFQSSRAGDRNWLLRADRGAMGTQYAQSEFSFTLTETPQFALNGQAVYFGDTETAELSDEVKTAGKIALGAGLITVAAAVVSVGIFLATYDGDGT